ncbi:DNA alkylation repair protein [Streptomyces sp. TLI_171]|uniref:DNA alkylation repair protein n=1 Tax=Streptomyces sp. TLI_171 TaxID=1938859 RepID=UPI000C18B1A9|nr:DNA alkylation repair protein [Streptomyces sp. TLI_171]RKE17435.1 3-methyladenine DNA glycosylase AlkC [Streptomyces sp. TLI_171]
MPTADELISAGTVHGLAAVLREAAPRASDWRAVTGSAAGLGALGLSERARTVGAAMLADVGGGYGELASAVRAALARPELTGWMIWPVSEAVATAATAPGGDFADGLHLLAELTPRLTAEFALRGFLLADLDRSLAAALAWTRSPDPAVRRLASEGTRPRLPWARQVPALTAAPGVTLPILDALYRDEDEVVRRSVANHLNDLSRLDPGLATATAAGWARRADGATASVVRHAMRTLVKDGDPAALELVGFHGGREDLRVLGPLLERAEVPVGGALTFTARVTNVSDAPVSLVIDYVVHHRKANGRTSPKVFKLTKRNLEPGASAELTRSHSFRPISTRVYHPGEHALQLQVNGHRFDTAVFELTPAQG